MKCTVASLATKCEKSYSETVNFVRTRLSFATLRSASLFLDGSRVGLGFDDGADSLHTDNKVILSCLQ